MVLTHIRLLPLSFPALGLASIPGDESSYLERLWAVLSRQYHHRLGRETQRCTSRARLSLRQRHWLLPSPPALPLSPIRPHCQRRHENPCLPGCIRYNHGPLMMVLGEDLGLWDWIVSSSPALPLLPVRQHCQRRHQKPCLTGCIRYNHGPLMIGLGMGLSLWHWLVP